MAVDASGRWITTNGYAEVNHVGPAFQATLLFVGTEEPYHELSATIEPDGNIGAVISSPGRDTPPFELSGRVFYGAVTESGHATTVLLTDGTTVLGLALGPHSDEENL